MPGQHLELRHAGETFRIEAWGVDGVRVRISPDDAGPPATVDGLLTPHDTTPTVTVTDEVARLVNGCTVVELRRWQRSEHDTVHLLWSARHVDDAQPWLAERPAHWNLPARDWRPASLAHTATDGDERPWFSVAASFAATPGEQWFGLGQHQHGLLNQKGAVIDMVQRNTEVAVPVLVSSFGNVVVWNHPGTGRVELGTASTRLVADATRQLDFWVSCPRSVPVAVERFTAVTGRSPIAPRWLSGFWQSRLRYSTQREVLDVVHEHLGRGLPLSAIVIDFFHWTRFGEFGFDSDSFPDPTSMVAELRALGVEVIVSTWPTFNPATDAYQEMAEQGWLLHPHDQPAGQLPFFDKPDFDQAALAYYDAFSPAARADVTQRIIDGYVRHEITNLWVDACEPEMFPERHRELRSAAGPLAAVGCAYPVLHAGSLAGALARHSLQTPVLLCRSGWLGAARHGMAVWSGDVPSTWDALARHVPAGLNIGVSGVPWWTHDIGGFKGGRPEDPDFRELLVRWFELGVFSPICRLHGMREPSDWSGGAPNEVWSFGDGVAAMLTELLTLRETLRPTIDGLFAEASARGHPVIRPLWWANPDDPIAWEIDAQWSLGDDIIFAPVVAPGVHEVRCYLPAGSWVHPPSGEHFTEGWICHPAPLGSPAWFRRAE